MMNSNRIIYLMVFGLLLFFEVGTVFAGYSRDTKIVNWWRNGDWVIDKIEGIDSVETFTYDSDGRLSKWEYDGSFDNAITYSYDNDGYLTKTEEDDKNDGTIQKSDVYTYDGNGNLTRIDYSFNTAYTNHSYASIYTYNGNGMLTESSETESGSLSTYTYDSNNNLIRIETDYENDGKIDYVIIYTYDSDNNETKFEEDYDNDGNIDASVTYTYDNNGNVLSSNYSRNYYTSPSIQFTYTWKKLPTSSNESDTSDDSGSESESSGGSGGGCFISAIL